VCTKQVAPHSEADAPAAADESAVAADESAVAAVADHAKWELLRQLAAFMTFVFFVVPVAVIAIAFIFGVLLAEVEGTYFPNPRTVCPTN
jgi:hypothetical protein